MTAADIDLTIPASLDRTRPRYQFLPDLAGDDYDALKADIAERGVMVPIEYDDDGNVLDGHHRIKACAELGISEWPRIVRTFASEADKRTHARQLNLARRHLNQEQRRVLIADDLRERPDRSNRQIAAELGVDDKTVGTVRAGLEATAEIPQLEKTVGADGRSRRKPSVSRVHLPGDDGKAAVKGAARTIRDEETEAKRAANDAVRAVAVPSPSGKYSVLVIDPPWPMDKIERDVRPNQVAFDYAHAAHDDAVAFSRWYVIDLAAWRAHMIRHRDIVKPKKQSNGDGTHFVVFDLRTFPPNPPILVGSSHELPTGARAA
ncbi:MAG: ParB N-terminal domain-containing protein [Hyphomicrobiales bacterium]|nr:ParB N-terminal domain-containing protein [Hyphomicrobiales bacterium]